MDGIVQYDPRNVERVFGDFNARRAGIIKALTTDVKRFFKQCDPKKDNLCLYGHPDEQWEVKEPAEEVPPGQPEPALGINFARDEMIEKDWLSLIAVHSDAWLLSLAFYFGSIFGFDKADRRRLFNMINDLPTIFEVFKKHGGTFCGECGGKYNGDEFWIYCDICETWYHGKCVKMTPTKAEYIDQYKCPSCSEKRAHP